MLTLKKVKELVTHDEKGNALLTLVGKGEKARRVKITSSATQLLDKYIASRKISTELVSGAFGRVCSPGTL